jgi:probable HAF family extracellular repeat protein
VDEINLGTFGFVYDGSQVINLGTLPGGTQSHARSINDAGQVVGYWGNNVTGPLPLAFLWQDGQMTDVSPDFGTPKSRANAINDFGQATGWMGSNFVNSGNAFIWHNGEVIGLPSLTGAFRSEGYGINNSAHVVGGAKVNTPEGGPVTYCAFVWNGSDTVGLGNLKGFIWSEAYGINDSDVVVGASFNSGGNLNISRAFLWQNGVMTDLNDLIPPSLGITIVTANGINNGGQIAGTANPSAGGNEFAVLLTPVAKKVGDLNGDCTVGITDFLALLSAWGSCPLSGGCPADLNGDGSVGIVDFLTLLANWG